MEKRLFIAIALSFGILSLWSIIFPPPKPVKNLQVIENKEVTSVKAPAQSASRAVVFSKNEKLAYLENDQLKIELTNIGGTINKINLKSYNYSFPVWKIGSLSGFENAEFKLESSDNLEITYISNTSVATVRKTFTLDDDYLIKEKIEILNMSNLKDVKYTALSLNMSNLDIKKVPGHERDVSLYEYAISAGGNVVRKGNAYKFSSKEDKVGVGQVRWASYRDRYLALIVKPDFDTSGYNIKTEGEHDLDVNLMPKEDGAGNLTLSTTIFAGPQKLDLLKSKNIGIEEVMSFSGFGLVDFLAKAIYNLMHFIHKIIPQWGVVVIILSLIVYFSMYPLTLNGMNSMKRMQAIQPKLNSLREQHKNNPQKLNKEVVELYKEHKINPLAGCLPFLLQMPVFIALYQVLWRSVSIKGEGFLWIKDLSEPDRLVVFSSKLPFIGHDFNILPILMAIIMFLQQRLSAKSMVITDEAQAAQQKMMSFMFPIMLGFVFYHFASVLSLYFTLFYALSAFTQWKVSKQNV